VEPASFEVEDKAEEGPSNPLVDEAQQHAERPPHLGRQVTAGRFAKPLFDNSHKQRLNKGAAAFKMALPLEKLVAETPN
jgi:hypothetical protein